MKLNIACGPNAFPGWTNIDRVDMSGYIETLRSVTDFTGWPEAQAKLAARVKEGLVTCEVHDLRKGFPDIPDESVDAIYFGQAIEHLNPLYEAPQFLRECLRMLKPGAQIRITTPDFDMLLDAYLADRMGDFAHEQPAFYADSPKSAQFSYLAFGACGPECTFDRYEGHFCLYSREHMTLLLEQVGFCDVSFDRKSPEFAECVDAGMSHSMAVEARKP